jgi:hypothetical protein
MVIVLFLVTYIPALSLWLICPVQQQCFFTNRVLPRA